MLDRSAPAAPRERSSTGENEQVELSAADIDQATRIAADLRGRSIVLVGMMGAGKTSVGRRLAAALHLPFVDADAEIESAANLTIPEIFATMGEEKFRDGERRVIARLLGDGPKVIATGGGAFMAAETRRAVRANGISVWLKAELPILMDRVRKKSNRPLLQHADPEEVMRSLLAVREPVYAEADLMVVSNDGPHQAVVADLVARLERFLESEKNT
ncbi:shikimate kinase [Propylenella binzhouense]|uniref:Shikimate kinase n=1 Tax=Propylenella binzhouense TaxID=2555902 RepID=A0A964WVD7_9HYPH|nr:shikimate kinase [Propylenella binzhouense]MYZ50076.1 shikimate kinase [Propylenella binzhouense]